MKQSIIAVMTFCLLACFLAGCGNSKKELSFQDIPNYPASTPEQHMEGPGIAGMPGGELIQLSTTDPFDTVVEFYSDELGQYQPEILSHTSGLGRQTALTIQQENKVITVTIQEHGRRGPGGDHPYGGRDAIALLVRSNPDSNRFKPGTIGIPAPQHQAIHTDRQWFVPACLSKKSSVDIIGFMAFGNKHTNWFVFYSFVCTGR